MRKFSFELRIENNLSEIKKVLNHFHVFAENHALPEKLVSMVNVAFDEFLSNTITYGFDDDKQHEILIMVQINESILTIRIEDDGIEFNPFDYNSPDTSLPINDRSIGGLGIHIVKTIMDEYDYKRISECNVIALKKKNINKN